MSIEKIKKYARLIRGAIAGQEEDYTKGGLNRAIFLLSVPMILEMAMESLFAVVDAFYVSKISNAAIATVGFTETILTLVYSVAIGLSAAATALVARRIGEKNKEAASQVAAQVVLICLVLSLLIGIPGYIYAEDILYLMSGDRMVAKEGASYAATLFGFNLPILMIWVLNGVFRGSGDPAIAMRALWIANIVNIVLDPLFIFGFGPVPAMGVHGAAIATSIGRSTGVVYQLYQLMNGKRIIQIAMQRFIPDRETIRKLLEIAAGGTGQYLIGSASWIFMIYILGMLGTNITAGYTIAIRVVVFTILPSWGLANAAATLVGQNLGANQADRAEKSVWHTGHINMVFMLVVGVVYLIFAPSIIRLFTTDPEVVNAGALALRIISGGYFLYGYGMIFSQALNGAGDTRTPTLLNFVFFWLVESPLAYLLAIVLGWGQIGVYCAIIIAESGLAIAAMWVFNKGHWKTVKV